MVKIGVVRFGFVILGIGRVRFVRCRVVVVVVVVVRRSAMIFQVVRLGVDRLIFVRHIFRSLSYGSATQVKRR